MNRQAPEKLEPTRKAILQAVSTLYHEANLVHADLSEYNIMLWKGPVIIDISQAVVLDHPHSELFFERDVRNIIAYFDDYDIPKLDLTETITAIRQGEYK
jgi:RIO kinase 1